VHVRLRRNLWEMRHAKHLMLRGDSLQALAECLSSAPSKPCINLIKDQRPTFARIAECLFKCE
jgi:hypothetical protein